MSSAHTNSSGTNLAIRNNQNPSSDDHNPYAYPYYRRSTHSVYDLVVQFGGMWTEEQQEEDDDENNSIGIDSLVQIIIERIYAFPKEVERKDSCGDTSLHRLCQVARVNRIPKFHYFCDICSAILDVWPSATTSVNNWKETPLHQFVNHCAFPLPPSTVSSTTATTPRDNNNDTGIRDDDSLFLFPHLSTIQPRTSTVMAFFRQLCRNGAGEKQNIWKAYPLHDACELQGYERVPAHDALVNQENGWFEQLHICIIKQLLFWYPFVLVTRDSLSLTPLHRNVARTVGSPRILRFLIQKLLERGKNSWRNAILTGAPETANHKYHPIHSLWFHHLKPQSERQHTQPSPILLIKQLQEEDERQNEASKGFIDEKLCDKKIDVHHIKECLGAVWEKTLVLVKAQIYNNLNPPNFLHLHSMILALCPYHCIVLAAMLYPHELLLHNDDGETPMTLLLSAPCYQQHPNLCCKLISLLLRLERRTVSTATRAGRLPLHAAAQNLSWRGGLESILLADPRSVLLQDPETKLYPFMLAATNTHCQQAQQEQQQTPQESSPADMGLTSIFELLRTEPAVITYSI